MSPDGRVRGILREAADCREMLAQAGLAGRIGAARTDDADHVSGGSTAAGLCRSMARSL
jgi:hypothetical protein